MLRTLQSISQSVISWNTGRDEMVKLLNYGARPVEGGRP